MTEDVTHFPLRKLNRDVHMRHFLAPEIQHPLWSQGYRMHFVYRFYDADLRPLYIGLTYGGAHRWDQHRKRSDWWPLAEYVAVSFYPSYGHIQVAEKAAIRNEQPRFNKLHLRGRANVSIGLHGPAEQAAVEIFREADPDFIRELASLLTQPERFPQPTPPPPAQFANEAPTNERRSA